MPRRILFKERSSWRNPVKSVYPTPFLGDVIFPLDPDSPAAEESREILDRFYCDERVGGDDDLDKLKAFILNPDKQLFVIWGEVGIGKTWFVRYEFTCGELARKYQAGIIDILGGGVISDEETIYKRLCPILESYFIRFFGNVKDAFIAYARFRVGQQLGKDSPEEEILAEAKAMVHRWLPADYSKEYAERLLLALEYLNEPLLFIIVDNIDRAGKKRQTILLDMAKRILRNNRIRLIVPLRRASSLLGDRFKGLKEQAYDDMELTALKLDKMLQPRFSYSRDGIDLSKDPLIVDGDIKITFPELFERIFSSESGKLILTIAGKNAREALLITERLICSEHLRGLENIENNQFAIAALMLSDRTQLDTTFPYLINLFDNNEPRAPGNALIRFRILEYFYHERIVDPAEAHFAKYMERLGYDEERIKKALSLMVGNSMIYSQRGMVAETFDELNVDELGAFEIAEIGDAYWQTLIRMQWYFVCIKQGVIIPERYIGHNKEKDTEYINHADLYQFLKEEEGQEKHRIERWENKHGNLSAVHLESPSEIAKRALRRGRDAKFLNGSDISVKEKTP